MNPNDPNNLDPKIKQAYESVMSGGPQVQSTGPNPTPAQNPQAEANQQFAQQAPMMQTEQVTEQSPLTASFNSSPMEEDVLQSPLFKGGNFANPNPSAQDAQEAIAPKKNKIFPIILTLGLIVFFVVYVVVWSKFFGLF